MAMHILAKDGGFTNPKRGKISLVKKKQEVSMVKNRPILDLINAKERLSVPFAYRLHQLKFAALALILNVGVAI